MRVPITIVGLGVVAGFALVRSRPEAVGHLPPPAGRIVERGQRTVRRGADLVGLCAYLAAMNRRLPERQVLRSVYRATGEGTYDVPFWGGLVEAPSMSEREPVPAGVGQVEE